MTTKSDKTARERVNRQRQRLQEAGGARVEAHLDATEVGILDAVVADGRAKSRREALKYAVRLLQGRTEEDGK